MTGTERKRRQRKRAVLLGRCPTCCCRPKTEGMKTCADCRQRIWDKRHAA